jgi:flavin-dependent dehydrogenase
LSEHNYDVIIIGGCPARLFAGIACARNELQTLVLEKQTYPIDKACGEGIKLSSVNYFKKLGVAPFLEKYPYHLFKGGRYVSAKGSVAEVYFAEG